MLHVYRQMAGQFRHSSVWPPMTSQYYQTGQSPPHRPAIICPSSSLSTPNCPRLMGRGEPTSTLGKLTGHVVLKLATNTLLKLLKQVLSNKRRKPSGKQCIKPVASSFRPVAFTTSSQPCRHQPNRSPMNETKCAD